ncbi:MAG: asparagine synthase (glutamine-hydrolyzing), partial [Planctomycetota bacterium]
YAYWGEDAIGRLRGMFALAIWDRRDRTVLLARDRIGIKPLFLSTVKRPGGASALLFASELRSLMASGLIERRLHQPALDSYLWNGFVVGPDAIVAGVQMLPPGTLARIDPRVPRCEPRSYWQLPVESAGRDGVERLRHELGTAMRQHMVSDVPLGVFLSGGIDSSAVAAMAAEQASGGPGSVRTFNISFDEVEFDESKYARAVAGALGTDHMDVRLTQGHFLENLDDALSAIDQPTFDGINTYFVSRAVREAGITVALAGTGGDELFGGYKSFVDVPKSARAARLSRMLPGGVSRAAANGIARWKLGRFGELPPQTRWGKLGDVLCSGGGILDAYQIFYGMFTEDVHAALQGGRHAAMKRGLSTARSAELAALVAGSSPRHAVSTLEIANFLGERLLRDTDWSGMAVSLEVRVPLLDHGVIEAVAAVESGRRYEPLGKKHLLRELALSKIDAAIFDRPKSGFVLPIEAWCRQGLRDEVAEVLTDKDLCTAAGLDHATVGKLWRSFSAGAPGMYWSRIWVVFVLLRWCREHRVAV